MAHRRGGGEGHVVEPAPASRVASPSCSPTRFVELQHVHVGASSRRRSRGRRAPDGPRDERAPHRPPASAPRATRRPTPRARCRRRCRARRERRPSQGRRRRASRRPASARRARRRPGVRTALDSGRACEQIRSYGAGAAAGRVQRTRGDHRRLDDPRAELPEPPGERAAAAHARGSPRRRPGERAGREPRELSASRATSPTTVIEGARTAPARRARDRRERSGDRALAGPACPLRRPPRARRGASGGDQRGGDLGEPARRPCRARASRERRQRRPVDAPRPGLTGSSLPVTSATAVASARWVTGMPA